MKDPYIENAVVSLFKNGWGIRRIAKEFHISRNRVRRILAQNQIDRQQTSEVVQPKATRSSKLDPYKTQIHEVLEKYKDNPPTAQRIFEIIVSNGYNGGISTLRNYLAKVRPKKKKEVIITVETEVGQRGQHDWSEYDVLFTETNTVEKVLIFSFILSYSRRQYLEVVTDETQLTLFQALINAFTYFGGVPREIKGDNQKACVDRWEARKPIYNTSYLKFATHYQFRPLTIRPRTPKENLKVERPFYFLETNFFNARTFYNRDDFKAQLKEWLVTKNDLRIHRTTKRQPFIMYQEEKDHLLPLPKNHFDTSKIVHRIVNAESCIEYKGFFYAVPAEYLFESCPVRITTNELMVYSNDAKLLIIHQLADENSRERYIGHRQSSKKTPPPVPISKVISDLKAWDDSMNEFIKQIKAQKGRSYSWHLRKLYILRASYHITDIVIALKRALRYKVFDYRSIENFLNANMKKKNDIKLFPNRRNQHE